MKKDFKLPITSRKTLILALCALVGAVLLIIPFDKDDSSSQSTDSEAYSDLTEYTADLEERIKNLVTSVGGIEQAAVLVTLESGSRTVLASDTDSEISSDKNRNSSSPITVERNGDGEAVPICEICPRIRGVAVVCDMGDDPTIRSKLTALISAALGITTNHIMISA